MMPSFAMPGGTAGAGMSGATAMGPRPQAMSSTAPPASPGIPGMRMAKGALVISSKSRKKGGNSRTLRRGAAYRMVKAGADGYYAGDYASYHNTAGGEAMSAMAPVSSLSGTGLKAGGIVRGPVNALIGEAGPEVVIPMKKKFMNKKVKDVAKHFAKKGM